MPGQQFLSGFLIASQSTWYRILNYFPHRSRMQLGYWVGRTRHGLGKEISEEALCRFFYPRPGQNPWVVGPILLQPLLGLSHLLGLMVRGLHDRALRSSEETKGPNCSPRSGASTVTGRLLCMFEDTQEGLGRRWLGICAWCHRQEELVGVGTHNYLYSGPHHR